MALELMWLEILFQRMKKMVEHWTTQMISGFLQVNYGALQLFHME